MTAGVDESKLVSAIIPTHDRPKLLRRAIKSVEAQTHNPIELIVVGSPKTPNVDRIVDESDVYYSKYIDAGAESPGAARNVGIEKANGEFIAFLDDDETWDEEKIERQITRILTSGSEVCHTGVRKVGPEGKLRAISRANIEGEVTILLLIDPPYGAISAMMLRREIAEKVDGFDEDLTLLEENDFNIRISEYATFCTVSEPLVTRYIEGHQQITDDLEQAQLDSDIFIQKHRNFARGFGPDIEKKMIARINRGVAKTAANQANYLTAIQMIWKAIKYDPKNISNIFWLGIVSGGPMTYKPAQYTKRVLVRMANSTNNRPNH